jgi:hypothetical protein
MSGMNRIGRRRFVQLMGWAGAAAVARGGPALAQGARKPKVAAPAEPPPSPAPTNATATEVSEEARTLAEVVKRRHGEHLSQQDLETIARDLDGDLRGMRRLREVKLANAEEPDSTFRA